MAKSTPPNFKSVQNHQILSKGRALWINQPNEAGVCIYSNQYCRESGADFARFLQIALGSATELEYLFMLATSLGLIDKADYDKLHEEVVEIKKMLTSFIKKLRVKERLKAES